MYSWCQQGVSSYDDGEGKSSFCIIEGKSFFITQDVCQISLSKDITGVFGAQDENGNDFPPAVACRRYCKMETGDDLKLIGRISNVTKLSNGEFVSLELIEDVISAPGVAQCMVAASGHSSFVVAIVVPVSESVCCSAEEQDHLYSRMLATAQQNGLRPYEIPSRMNVKFVSEKWSPENGCLNAAMKLDRRGVLRRYQKDIEEMLATDSKPHLSPRGPAHEQLTVETLCGHLSRRVRASVCGSDRVDDVKFLGQDSLAIMSLLHDIRSTFALPSLPPNHWFSSGTLSGFVSNIQRLNFSTSSGGMLETIPAQVTQDDEELLQGIRIQGTQSFGAASHSTAPVLLTGVTGFLGVHLLEQLLKQSESRPVYCIIRRGAAGADDARERLVSTIHKYKVVLSSAQMGAVRVLAGDVAQPRFGLGLEEYQALCEEVGCVYHNASEVNWLMTYSQLRSSNVIGTLNAIQFAASGRSKWLHYVSTLSTCKGASLVEKPPAGGGYLQSKWVAERLVHKAALRGLQATVCRPGTIGPHSVTGACNVTDYATCFILSIAQNGIYLDSNNEFELSPVDCVAGAVVAVAMQAMSTLDNSQVQISNDCVSSASSLSDKVPSASPKCANSPILSRNLSSNTVGLVATPRSLNRTNSASSALAAHWQEKHCFNLSYCLPVLTNQVIGRLICQTLELPPRPVGHETFYRSQV
jgi:thioester reductase-like protein